VASLYLFLCLSALHIPLKQKLHGGGKSSLFRLVAALVPGLLFAESFRSAPVAACKLCRLTTGNRPGDYCVSGISLRLVDLPLLVCTQPGPDWRPTSVDPHSI